MLLILFAHLYLLLPLPLVLHHFQQVLLMPLPPRHPPVQDSIVTIVEDDSIGKILVVISQVSPDERDTVFMVNRSLVLQSSPDDQEVLEETVDAGSLVEGNVLSLLQQSLQIVQRLLLGKLILKPDVRTIHLQLSENPVSILAQLAQAELDISMP